MNAFHASKNTRPMTFDDLDGRQITVRPLFDADLDRNIVELVIHGATVRLSNGIIPSFTDGLTTAAAVGEIENALLGNPTKLGE